VFVAGSSSAALRAAMGSPPLAISRDSADLFLARAPLTQGSRSGQARSNWLLGFVSKLPGLLAVWLHPQIQAITV
jgi:hypothetical protein